MLVFLRENEEKPSFPTAPKNGFPERPASPMVAAFWQDGDVSYTYKGEQKGDVYYQVRRSGGWKVEVGGGRRQTPKYAFW